MKAFTSYVREDGTVYLIGNKVRGIADTFQVNTVDAVETIGKKMKLDKAAEERAYAIFLDAKLHPIGTYEISHGTMDSASMNPREVFRAALVGGACSIILMHNHLSGSMEPSDYDVKTTQKLIKAGEMIGINVLDHVIISRRGCYSIKVNRKGVFG